MTRSEKCSRRVLCTSIVWFVSEYMLFPCKYDNLCACKIWSFHSGDCAEFFLLGYNLVQTAERPYPARWLRCPCFFFGLLFIPVDTCGMFLRNVGWLSVDYSALTPIKWQNRINNLKKNSMVWVRERTMPTERPPFFGEVIAKFWS
jgi:hypothetical protein